jgi:hypothetical protein
MKKNKFIAMAVTLSAIFTTAFGQDDTRTDNHTITVVIPNIAILDLEANNKDFTSTFAMPGAGSGEAGDKIGVPVNNTDLWLNYTSILPATGAASRRVDVKASALVPGVDIRVLAATATTGAGTLGTPTASFILTTADQPIVNTIGSAYTVSGISQGHQLTYSFEALEANFGNIRAASTPVLVTYTLVDN